MATSVAQTATIVSNPKASPAVLNDPGLVGGRVRYLGETREAVTGDLDLGDTLVLAQLPVNARIWELWVWTDDLDTNASVALAWDFGFLDSSDADVDVDALSPTAIGNDTLKSTWTDVMAQSGMETNIGKTLWDASSGVTTDPGGEYKLIMQVQTAAATAAAGTISYRCVYTID